MVDSMKTSWLSLALGAVAALLMSSVVASAIDQQAIAVSGRYHVDHSAFVEWPYDDGDVSVGAAYEIHDGYGYWQLGADYGIDPSGEAAIDEVWTPYLNLMLKDNFWRGGVGALANYISSDEDDSDWSDLFYQFILGFSVPLGSLSVDLLAYYPFEAWDKLDEFEVEDIEGGLLVRYAF